jgi:CopG family nickel-responsive transcriptional regulator
MGLKRFGVSIDSNLLKKFDKQIKQKGYSNRSEAFRDMIRESFLQEDIKKGKGEMVGSVTIIYNHHEMELPKTLTEEQHKHHGFVLSSVHVHLDHHNCMEVVLLKGKVKEISDFANKLISRRGVKHGKLMLAEKDF